MKYKICVTGGAGFMGSWLVDELIKKGHEVVVIDDFSGGNFNNLPRKLTDKNINNISLNKEKHIVLETILEDVDIVYHLAAYAAEGQSVFSPISINDINITSMNKLMVAAINSDVKKFVFTSSMAVYGRQKAPFEESQPRMPVDPYGAAKAYCENMLEIFHDVYGMKYCIIRPHNVYGPRQNISDAYRNVIGIWMNRILRNKPPIIYGTGDQKRAFSYIEDITPPLAHAGLSRATTNQIINLGSDEVITINKACEMLLKVTNSNLEPIYEEARPNEVENAYCTTSKSADFLKYETDYPLIKGMEKMWLWAKTKGAMKPTYLLPLEISKNAPRIWLNREM